jgi:hypothetical protein
VSSRRGRREPGNLPAFPLGRAELIAAGFLVFGIIAIIAAVAVTSGGGGSSTTSAPEGSPTPAPSASGVLFQPADADGEAIVALARKSIESLPQGQWPSLYDDFVASFQARCSATDFAQGGVDSANALGSNLSLLAFKFMQDVVINGEVAHGTIVGELTGISEYQVSAYFAREDGVWKLDAAPDTTGCEAFTRISG